MKAKRFVISILMTVACWSHSSVIYQDDFSGSGSSDLAGTAPDIRPGSQMWTGGGFWNADGSKAANANHSAYLEFTPESGKIYTFSVDINSVADGGWLGMGFTKLNPNGQSFSTADQAVAAPWMLQRNDRTAANVVATYKGPDVSGGANYDDPNNVAGLVEAKIVLDTTNPNWTAEWFYNGQSIRSATYEVDGLSGINYIGLSSNLAGSGAVDNLSLTVVPEPATLGMLGVSAGLLLLIRRRFL